MKTITTILIAAFLATGCAGAALEARRDLLTSQGHPKPYVDGYMDGCASGRNAAGNSSYTFTKDVQRFDRDRLYRQGWPDGFQSCKGESEANRRALGY